MEHKQKLFAFKLAAQEQRAVQAKQDAQAKHGKWKARDGVSLAGCTDQTGDGDYREGDSSTWC